MVKSKSKDSPAIEALKERMDRDPLSRAFLQLAEEYRRMGRYEEAVEVCLDGLSRHPSYHTARIALGRNYLEGGNLEDARRALGEVFESMPENHRAGKLLAQTLDRLGERSAAAEICREVLRHYPGDEEIESMLAQLTSPSVGSDAPAAPSAAPLHMDATPAMPGAPEDGPEAPPAVESAPEDDRAEALPKEVPGATTRPPDERPDVIQTNTLAELYLRQGLVDKAVEVYRGMLKVDPDNDTVRGRLEELAPGEIPHRPPRPSDDVGAESAAELAAPPDPVQAPGSPRVPPNMTEPVSPGPDREEPGKRETMVRLERWLATIQAGSGEVGSYPP